MSWSVIIFVIKSNQLAFFITFCVQISLFLATPQMSQNRDKIRADITSGSFSALQIEGVNFDSILP